MPARRWDPDVLESNRRLGDPVADAMMEQVAHELGIERVNDIFRSLVDNEDIQRDDMPAPVRAYLRETGTLPDWADPEALARAADFFAVQWPQVVTILFCGSLPSAYSAWRGAQVLYLTQRLTSHVHRRIFETAQFVLDVMAPGAMGPEGRAIEAAQKVRLMHAAVRHGLREGPRAAHLWDEDWGVPINQEDLAGTLMTFSTAILVGLERFHVPVSSEDREAYMHAWNAIGHLMGVRPELLPRDFEDGQALADAIFQAQKGPSEAGSELMKALMTFMDAQLPGRLLDDLPPTIIRHLVDADVADMLDVPRGNWTAVLLRADLAFARLEARVRGRHPRSRVMERLSDGVVQAIIDIERGGSRGSFRIPASLRDPI